MFMVDAETDHSNCWVPNDIVGFSRAQLKCTNKLKTDTENSETLNNILFYTWSVFKVYL